MASSILPELKLKDIMRTPVYTVEEGDTVEKAAKIMAEHGVGSVVVVNAEGKPIGILTERDLVRRVMVKNLLPSEVKVGKVMSSPLVTVSPDIGVDEAARQMGRLGVKKLVVIDRGEILGIVSSREIIQTTPQLFDVIYEKLKTGMVQPRRARATMAGYCETCGQWSDSLVEANGSFLCEECAAEVGGSE